MELLTYFEFWNSNPAPGTRYHVVTSKPSEIIANDNEWLEDYEIDNVVLEKHPSQTDQTPMNSYYLVLEWGSWETEEAANSKRIHNERIELLRSEFDVDHNCGIGF